MEKLKICVLLDTTCVPAWIYKILKDIVRNGTLMLDLVIITRSNDSKKSVFLNLLMEFEKILFSKKRDAFNALTIIELQHEFFDHIKVFEKNSLSLNYLDGDALHYLEKSKLDILLNLSEWNVDGMNQSLAKKGVWTLVNNFLANYQGPAPLFHYIGNEARMCSIALVRNVPPSEHKKKVYRYTFSAYDRFISRFTDKVFWKSAIFVIRCLKTIADEKDTALDYKDEFTVHSYSNDLSPSAFHWVEKKGARKKIFFLFNYFYNNILKQLFVEHWTVMVCKQAGASKIFPLSINQCAFFDIPAPKGRYFADPFLFADGKQAYLFFEDYSYETGKGCISCCLINLDGSFGPCTPVLERPYHLSYPFIFSFGEMIYMVPESSYNNTIELYKCISFPDKWVLEKVLIDNVVAYDTTLLYRDSYWWLFTTIDDPLARTSDELHLFFSKELFGEWTPHLQNPIVSNLKSGRSAGRITEQEGMLIRPAQDCTVTYGQAVNLYHIEALDTEQYIETFIAQYRPNRLKGYMGMHTINANLDFIAIDQKKYKFRWNVKLRR